MLVLITTVAANIGIPRKKEAMCFPGSWYRRFSGRKEKRIRFVFRHQSRSMTTRSNNPSPSPNARKNKNTVLNSFKLRTFFIAMPRIINTAVKRIKFPSRIDNIDFSCGAILPNSE